MTSTVVNNARRQGVPTGPELDDLLSMSRGLSFILLAAYGMFLTFQLWSKYPMILITCANNQPTRTCSDCQRPSRCILYPTDRRLTTLPSSLDPTGSHRWEARLAAPRPRQTATPDPCADFDDGQ
jgi:hypothetical protein